MGVLPRPDVAPGPRRELVDALHALHHEAGWPSLRRLAADTGVSHTTVSKALSAPTLPSWGTVELLAEAMGGDVERFRDLWLSASTPADAPLPTASRIAGRSAELAAVRRHLETGTGLLLVTGEAGMGKTKLVATAVASSSPEVFVAVGSCLPLSSEAPLMPVSDAMRSIDQHDEGRWLAGAVSRCAPYVIDSVTLLVPELARREVPAAPSRDELVGHRLFSAVEATLRSLCAERRLSLLLEDLHWGDTATLDLIEHLITRDPNLPIIGTWRLDDPTTRRANVDWFSRIRRSSAVTTLSLPALSRNETSDQLTLLTGRVPEEAFVDAIHGRTQGQPLFTEQLAAHAHADSELPFPALLADVLDARLGDLTGPAWAAARALSVADRPLTTALLAQIAGLTPDDLTACLHDLDSRRLLSPSQHEAALRHPLLAEAIRRRLVAGEAAGVHMSVAGALAATTDPEPAEVARHWCEAGNNDQELVWRVRAARSAHERFAVQQEADQWVRALELWPGDDEFAGEPPVRRYEALVSVMSIYGGVEPGRAVQLTEDALQLVPQLSPLDAAALLHLAGDHYANGMGETTLGLDLLDRAIAIYKEVPPIEGHVHALATREAALTWNGRHEEAAATVARGLAVSTLLEDPRWYRRMLIRQAWYDVRAGDLAVGLSRASEAAGVIVEGPDPEGEADLAIYHCDLLMMTAAPVDSVVAAGRRGLAATTVWDRETYLERAIRFTLSVCERNAGHVHRAAAFIDAQTATEPSEGRWRLHLERARLDIRRGHRHQAAALVEALASVPVSLLLERIDVAECLAEVGLWLGRPGSAYDHLVPLLREASHTDAAEDLGPALLLAAGLTAAGPADLRGRLDDLSELRDSCAMDPFAIRAVPADRIACAATWRAEMSRRDSTESTRLWLAAVSEWDKLGRPHDAAYCRWRGARIALREGQGTVAARLLKKAAADAREHVPLSDAIATGAR